MGEHMSVELTTGSPIVDSIGRMNISGNMIPENWYHHVLSENGRVDLVALTILADIIYWYKPSANRDCHGRIINMYKKFKSDMLQMYYIAWEKKYNISDRKLRRSVKNLVRLGIIRKDIRTEIRNDFRRESGIVYFEPVPEKIYEITFTLPDNTNREEKKCANNSNSSPTPLPNLVRGYATHGEDTYTTPQTSFNPQNSSYEEFKDSIGPSGPVKEKPLKRTSKTEPENLSKSQRTRPVKRSSTKPGTKKISPGKGNGASPNPNSKKLRKSQNKPVSLAKDATQISGNGKLFSDEVKAKARYENKENISLFRYWNEQPNLTTHRKNTRTYKQCLELIQALRTGTLIEKINVKNFKGNGVSVDDLEKEWTVKEIRKVIKIINEQHKMGYWPDNKAVVPKNLASAIYNPRTGKSWFLTAFKFGLTEVKKPKDCLSDELKQIYNKLEYALKTLRCQDDIQKYEQDLVNTAKDLQKYYKNMAHNRIKNDPHMSDVFYSKFSSAKMMTEKFKTFLLKGDFDTFKSITPKGLQSNGNMFKKFINEWEEYLGLSFSKGGPLYEE
jgi:hypothetical protein